MAQDTIAFDAFREQWLADVRAGNPSTVELGRRFAQKLIRQWADVDDASSDLVYCDGSGDGGIDLAYLDRGDDDESAETNIAGHSWYLVQSKFGSAFKGTTTLLHEGQKVIDTLDGKRTNLSSLAEGLLERLLTFRNSASEHDRIVLLFATEGALDASQKQTLDDLRAMGRNRLGSFFEVEAISIETIFQRTLEDADAIALQQKTVNLNSNLVRSGKDLLVGSTPLHSLYRFLKDYRDRTEDLDQLYEKNVRRFLGGRGKVNKGMQETLKSAPEQFGLYNNGITIVVADYKVLDEKNVELVEPYIVNGCQTTRTIWEVCHARLEAGGTGSNPELEGWRMLPATWLG